MTAVEVAPERAPEHVPVGVPDARRPRLPWFGTALATLALLGLWAVLYAVVLSPFEQTRHQHAAYAQLRETLARGTTPVAAPIADGTPIALLQVPAAGIHDLVVGEGTSSDDLTGGPGHLRSTPLPGQVGSSVLLGRSLTFGAPFAHLDRLRVGDPIIVRTGQGLFRFTVAQVGRTRSATFRTPASTAALTLATAAPGGILGAVSTDELFVVHAVLTGRAAPAPATLPAVSRDELPLAGDHSLVLRLELALALQLLLVVALAVAWAHVRWGRRQAWLVGAPVVLAALWLASGVAARLLPNLV